MNDGRGKATWLQAGFNWLRNVLPSLSTHTEPFDMRHTPHTRATSHARLKARDHNCCILRATLYLEAGPNPLEADCMTFQLFWVGAGLNYLL
jgi:hypothetical protein